MFNVWQMIAFAALFAAVCTAVVNVLWSRYHDHVRTSLEKDLRNLWEEIDTLEEMDEPSQTLTPEEREARRHIRHFQEHPEDYTVAIEESDDGTFVTVFLKDPEGGEDDV